MKTGKSLMELATELDRQNNAKRDFVADTRRLPVHLTTELDPTQTDAPPLAMEIDDEAFPIKRHAMRQIGERLKMPAKFCDRLEADHPDLLVYNINALFSREPQKRMVRTLDGEVRAFLSDRFRPLDNYDLAMAVMPALHSENAKMMSSEVTESRLYIKAVVPDMVAKLDPPPGAVMGQGHSFYVETIQAGLMISNSEIGVGRLSVQPAVFTRRCTNYAVFSDTSYFKHHLGGRLGSDADLSEYFSDETRKKTDEAVWNQVKDLATAALDGRIFEDLVKRLQAARGDQIEGKVPAVIEITKKKFGLTDAESEGVLTELIRSGDLSRFGLHAAITRFSSEVENYDRATELENLGGKIIELPVNDWMEIAKAA